MVDQTKMNGRPSNHRAGPALRAGVADLLHDVVTLAELQTQLVAVDLLEARQRSVVPVVMILAGALLALGTIPVLLLSIGWALINLAGLSEGAAYLITATVFLFIAAATAWAGWRRLNSALATLSRSQQELKNNVRWVKEALSRRSSTTRA